MIEEIRKAKEDAEERICETLQELERKTGMKVSSLYMRQNGNAAPLGGAYEYTVMAVDLELRL